jgi:hypothetical protein
MTITQGLTPTGYYFSTATLVFLGMLSAQGEGMAGELIGPQRDDHEE